MDIFGYIFSNRLARSRTGHTVLLLFLTVFAIGMFMPFVFAIMTAFKPVNELFLFPPRFIVRHPTTKNFTDLFNLMSGSWIPMSRYVFNTLLITVAGTFGTIIIASLCAYPVSRYQFPGNSGFFRVLQSALMYGGGVTAIPTFMIVAKTHMIDTYWAYLLPGLASPFALFIMKNFMDQMVPMEILESADMDGASEIRKFFRLVMPMSKPAWLTLTIFQVQALWGTGSSMFIYSEQLKTLNYALGQIASAGIARVGVGSAISILLLSFPLLIFIFTQSNILETMSTSGMKD
ncbi:MAG: carbohydrate ABC transporter permease [Oscillospiraceae bacterium]|jgi:ABC-type glycerol-3-phosphate transport system permease component|nr:carbohydrate ABC transporter permease [Oscillospiraceae bacterium]